VIAEHQVTLDNFAGPLDLLLYLVKRDEIDVLDIPIAQVADQFLEALGVLELIDVEGAGEFLVLAATLMEIKSRMLLPRTESLGEQDDDPRLELVKQLIEYKKFKEASRLLDLQAEKHGLRLPRSPIEKPGPLDMAQQPLRKVELWDLVSAFGRLVRETQALTPRQIVMDETPIHVHMARIESQLREVGPMPFRALFPPPQTRGRLLGIFLAILELIRAGKVDAEQDGLFGDIRVMIRATSEEAAAVGA
jgi:segregation and condensation protein A